MPLQSLLHPSCPDLDRSKNEPPKSPSTTAICKPYQYIITPTLSGLTLSNSFTTVSVLS